MIGMITVAIVLRCLLHRRKPYQCIPSKCCIIGRQEHFSLPRQYTSFMPIASILSITKVVHSEAVINLLNLSQVVLYS